MQDYLWREVPVILERWGRKEALQALEAFNIRTHSHWTDERARKEYVEGLHRRANKHVVPPKKKGVFERERLALLRASFKK
ncbi:hypothetical protein [Tumebacillus permanentifrigoris]|uniref:hypothetical protein n=1 Tax=Tumebacillus permanentifrigoris TaxID=378543 RepID=UPI000D6AA7F4|nr:hypothetical protein [Tumebacillus permanentifrigoris]